VNRFESTIRFSNLFIGESRKPTFILLSAPLLLITYKYFGSHDSPLTHLALRYMTFDHAQITPPLYSFLASFLLLGLVPSLMVKWAFREPLFKYGVRLGDIRFGSKAFLILAPVIMALAYSSSRIDSFIAEYPLYKGVKGSLWIFIPYAFSYALYYLGYEFFFRGYMQFGLRDRLGDWNAILIQTLASSLLHIGKPAWEIYGSIVAGIIWGLIVFRTQSLLFVVLLHWLLGISLDVFITYL